MRKYFSVSLYPLGTVHACLPDLTGCLACFVSVVEFRTEELMKKAVEKVNKHNLNGRPLKVKEVNYIIRKN